MSFFLALSHVLRQGHLNPELLDSASSAKPACSGVPLALHLLCDGVTIGPHTCMSAGNPNSEKEILTQEQAFHPVTHLPSPHPVVHARFPNTS